MSTTSKKIGSELKSHAPFTMFGALTGIVIMTVIFYSGIDRSTSKTLFWVFHPFHVFLSALATAGMYRLYSKGRLLPTLLIGYFGSIGIATLSDCVIPFLAESFLNWPNREMHLGFIKKWWLVNPLAFAGVAVAYFLPRTKFPHTGHVLLSTWASLFHMTMTMGNTLDVYIIPFVGVFLFLAVWIPCCMSDIVFPLLFAKNPVVKQPDEDCSCTN